MKIVIASDHAGFDLKKYLIQFIKEYDSNIEILDMGPDIYDENDDYPDYIKKVAEYISENNNPEMFRGIVIGGSGQGENICANKYKNIRSILVYGNDLNLNTQIAKLSREHNNANIISFGARFIENENAQQVLQTWLNTNFSNEERHVRRLSKLELN
jgi:ribose 5-phosphate isomerase B